MTGEGKRQHPTRPRRGVSQSQGEQERRPPRKSPLVWTTTDGLPRRRQTAASARGIGSLRWRRRNLRVELRQTSGSSGTGRSLAARDDSAGRRPQHQRNRGRPDLAQLLAKRERTVGTRRPPVVMWWWAQVEIRRRSRRRKAPSRAESRPVVCEQVRAREALVPPVRAEQAFSAVRTCLRVIEFVTRT
jgi:hypothetical protein